MPEFNFVGPKFDPVMQDELFGEGAIVQRFEAHETMAHLMVRAGKFSSVTQAKKNGWDKPADTNWQGVRVGQGVKRVDIYVYNPPHTQAELDVLFP